MYAYMRGGGMTLDITTTDDDDASWLVDDARPFFIIAKHVRDEPIYRATF